MGALARAAHIPRPAARMAAAKDSSTRGQEKPDGMRTASIPV